MIGRLGQSDATMREENKTKLIYMHHLIINLIYQTTTLRVVNEEYEKNRKLVQRGKHP